MHGVNWVWRRLSRTVNIRVRSLASEQRGIAQVGARGSNDSRGWSNASLKSRAWIRWLELEKRNSSASWREDDRVLGDNEKLSFHKNVGACVAYIHIHANTRTCADAPVDMRMLFRRYSNPCHMVTESSHINLAVQLWWLCGLCLWRRHNCPRDAVISLKVWPLFEVEHIQIWAKCDLEIFTSSKTQGYCHRNNVHTRLSSDYHKCLFILRFAYSTET